MLTRMALLDVVGTAGVSGSARHSCGYTIMDISLWILAVTKLGSLPCDFSDSKSTVLPCANKSGRPSLSTIANSGQHAEDISAVTAEFLKRSNITTIVKLTFERRQNLTTAACPRVDAGLST